MSASRTQPLRVLLVGNYAHDHFLSMEKFAAMLADGLARAGVAVRVVRPPPILGRLRRGATGLGKWLGYLDKFVLFAPRLWLASGWADVVHICDHGNAMYVGACRRGRVRVVTCHDLLAVRGALGEDTACTASAFGRWLQRWILSGLRRADCVPCVSVYTQSDALRLVGRGPAHVPLILNGLNRSFAPVPPQVAAERLAPWWERLAARPFVLHVGSNHVRKNRAGVVRAFAAYARDSDATLVLAGQPLPPALEQLIVALGVQERVLPLIQPSDAQVEALYSTAFATLFPSLSEGFGWPVVEAQACGCPVVASDIPPFREIAGSTVLMAGPEDVEGLAQALRTLEDPQRRAQLIAAGTANATRFTAARMVGEYLALYQSLLTEPSPALAVPA